MADIPDGADAKVAAMAIAWEMVKTSQRGSSTHSIQEQLKAFKEAYEGIATATKLQKESRIA